jgi:hypothetical protein
MMNMRAVGDNTREASAPSHGQNTRLMNILSTDISARVLRSTLAAEGIAHSAKTLINRTGLFAFIQLGLFRGVRDCVHLYSRCRDVYRALRIH